MSKTPDKIWINPLIDLPKLSGVIDKDSVQYVRTDAFIEKAEEFLYEKRNSGEMECRNIMTFINDFKKHIKGE